MAEYIKGLVSVIIPTYKRSSMLKRSIESVLNQTYDNLELILVNDNIKGDEYSKALYDLAETIHDKRFMLVEQEQHINGAAARNVGISKAKGEYIAFQDDDDYWENNKLELQVNLLASLDKTWGAVACLKKFYRDGDYISGSLPYKSGRILYNLLDTEISLGTGATLIRHTALDETGYFDESLFRHQDLQLFARLASKYKIMLQKIYLQNRDVSDAQNRPDAEKYRLFKEAYFRSVSDLIEQFPQNKQKVIYLMHDTEIAYAYFKKKNYKEFLYIIKRLAFSPTATFLLSKRVMERLIGKYFRYLLAVKYRP